MMKQDQLTELDDYIIEQTGADNWQMVVSTFKGLTKKEIKDILDSMFMECDAKNRSLTDDIYKRMKQV